MTSPYVSGDIGTYGLSNDPRINPLLVWGYKWGSTSVGTPVSLTYSFPQVGSDWLGNYYYQEPFNGFKAFTSEQQNAARAALDLWSHVANITFTEISENTNPGTEDVGDLRFGNSAVVTNSSSAAWAYLPYEDGSNMWPENGDVWFDYNYYPNLELGRGQFGFSTMIHEIGHAIGLDHPFADVAGELALPAAQNNQRYSIMAYNLYSGATIEAYGPMLYDIAAIQYLYGANMTWHAGDDVYQFYPSQEYFECIWDAGGHDTIDLSLQSRNQVINLNAGTFSSIGVKNNGQTGNGNVSIAFGAKIEDAIGGSGHDKVTGNVLANKLDGGSGNDTIVAGVGNDTYVIGDAGDTIDEEGNADSADVVRTTVSVNLASFSGGAIEQAILLGANAINATGNSATNVLTGNEAANILDGGGGADTLIGGKGNDTYVVDDAGDQVIEVADGDVDVVTSATISVSLASFANVENVTLTGSNNIGATGNGLANILTGNDGKNTLNGGGGADTLIGGKGDDTYLVDGIDDVISETFANGSLGGTDTVVTNVTYSIAAFANVDNIALTGGAQANATGNTANNILTGNGSDNVLDGGAAADTLKGGAGNDVYVIDIASDVIDEESNTDTGDEVRASFLLATTLAGIENYTYTGFSAWAFTGNGLDNLITGGTGFDTLDGGGGSDTLRGGAGSDVYLIDSADDVVDEQGIAGGWDEVRVSFLLVSAIQGIERYTYTGSSDWSFTGDGSNDKITGGSGSDILAGGAGDDWLDGGAGLDMLKGGSGNDTYVIDDAADTIDEEGNVDGADVVRAAVSVNLATLAGGAIERAVLLGQDALDATGNGLNNLLTGNDGNNILDGGGGNDVLVGGKGDDTYVIDSASDFIQETVTNAEGGGIDTVLINFDWYGGYTLHIDNVTITSSVGYRAVGNTNNNVITGNSGSDTLEGLDGADTLIGGGAGDTLRGQGGDDLLIGGLGDDHIEVYLGGRDTIDYNHLNEAGDYIHDFSVGAGGDILDLHDLLVDIGYSGSDPFADGYLSFKYNAPFHTTILVDADGAGAGAATTLATLFWVNLNQGNTDNYIV